MSLLPIDRGSEFQKLTDKIFDRQFQLDPALGEELCQTAKKKMYQDVRYNLDLIITALELGDDKIFESYARWLFQLLCPLMRYCTGARIRDQLVMHYSLLGDCLKPVVDEQARPSIDRLIDRAIWATNEECANQTGDTSIQPQKYREEIQTYLDYLMRSDTRGAMFLLTQYIDKGIPLPDIYADIAAAAMRMVGELWHQNRISVDREHYCTSTTQIALSQLYPVIFRQKRREEKVLVACAGSELHELAARMVADLFEYDGWDSIYLGAAVPAEAILAAAALHRPRLAVLSVTMPQHLPICRDTVAQLRAEYPEIQIAVGGRAFESTNEIWKNWSVDVYTRDARELVRWADHTLQ